MGSQKIHRKHKRTRNVIKDEAFMIWSLTFLDPKMRGHSEKYSVE
jgi:hypothetical protein